MKKRPFGVIKGVVIKGLAHCPNTSILISTALFIALTSDGTRSTVLQKTTWYNKNTCSSNRLRVPFAPTKICQCLW